MPKLSLATALLTLLLGACSSVPKYHYEGRPQAQLSIDGRKTHDPWLAGIELSADVYDFSNCASIQLKGRITGKAGALGSPTAIPAGKHLHIRFIHLVDQGRGGSHQEHFPFAFVPEPGAEYHVGIDTSEPGFKDFKLLKKTASGAFEKLNLKPWNVCHKN